LKKNSRVADLREWELGRLRMVTNRLDTLPEVCAIVAELRILIATDVLSEGQNLQDGAIIVNYDLPWAIIRLIQRAGRVDRIGQRSDRILCYSFCGRNLPSSKLPPVPRIPKPCRARNSITNSRRRGCSIFSTRRSPGAGRWGDRPGRASRRMNG
jgi:hypothetical protein